MSESDDTLGWEGYTASDTGAQVVIERADGEARIVLPEHWVAGRRRFSLLSVLGEQPLLQERIGERWATVEPRSPSALLAWAAWCEQQDDIPRGAAIEDSGDDEVVGIGRFAALLGRARRGDALDLLIDPEEEPQIVRYQLERAARSRGLTVQSVERVGDRLIIQLQALVEEVEDEE